MTSPRITFLPKRRVPVCAQTERGESRQRAGTCRAFVRPLDLVALGPALGALVVVHGTTIPRFVNDLSR